MITGRQLLRWLRRGGGQVPAIADPLSGEPDSETARERVAEIALRAVDADPSFAARFFPYAAKESAWITPKKPEPVDLDAEDGLAVPPVSLWAGYGDTPEFYVRSGREHHQSMLKVLAATGHAIAPGDRILDFGCAAGRMIRCFQPLAAECEVWGADIRADHILWCQQHLSPPFRFVNSTTFPHVPFEDNSFNLIYAGSVFTHIAELADAWLLELRRMLRPGGRMYITVSDNHTIDLIMSSPPGHWLHDTIIRRQLDDFEARREFRSTGYSMFVVSRDTGNAQVFYDVDYIRAHWGRFFRVLSIVPEAYGYQTAVILTK